MKKIIIVIELIMYIKSIILKKFVSAVQDFYEIKKSLEK